MLFQVTKVSGGYMKVASIPESENLIKHHKHAGEAKP